MAASIPEHPAVSCSLRCHHDIWHYRWPHSSHNFLFPFWGPTFSHFADLSFSVSEFLILSLNFKFVCFRLSPLFFLFPPLGQFYPHNVFPLCLLNYLHLHFSPSWSQTHLPTLVSWLILLNYLHLHFSPSWSQTHLPTLVSWLIHTETERLNSRRYVILGISLVVQWLRLSSPTAGGPGLIPGQGTRSHLLQLRVHILQLEILHATAKTWCSHINKFFKKENMEFLMA